MFVKSNHKLYSIMKDSPRRARFEKVAANRVASILKGLESLEKCSNKNNYEYNNDDIRKMEKALKEKLNETIKSFAKELDKGNKNLFKF